MRIWVFQQAPKFDDVANRFAGAVEKMIAILDRSQAPPPIEVTGLRTFGFDTDGLGNIMRETAQEMRKLADQTRDLTAAVQSFKVTPSDGGEPKKKGGLISWFSRRAERG